MGRRGRCVLWQGLVLETRLICDPWLKMVIEGRLLGCYDSQHNRIVRYDGVYIRSSDRPVVDVFVSFHLGLPRCVLRLSVDLGRSAPILSCLLIVDDRLVENGTICLNRYPNKLKAWLWYYGLMSSSFLSVVGLPRRHVQVMCKSILAVTPDLCASALENRRGCRW